MYQVHVVIKIVTFPGCQPSSYQEPIEKTLGESRVEWVNMEEQRHVKPTYSKHFQNMISQKIHASIC